MSSPCVRGALCGPISADEQGRSVLCGGLRPRRGGCRRRFFGENRCNRSSEGVTSADGVAAEAPGDVHPEKIGQPQFCWKREAAGEAEPPSQSLPPPRARTAGKRLPIGINPTVSPGIVVII